MIGNDIQQHTEPMPAASLKSSRTCHLATEVLTHLARIGDVVAVAAAGNRFQTR